MAAVNPSHSSRNRFLNERRELFNKIEKLLSKFDKNNSCYDSSLSEQQVISGKYNIAYYFHISPHITTIMHDTTNTVRDVTLSNINTDFYDDIQTQHTRRFLLREPQSQETNKSFICNGIYNALLFSNYVSKKLIPNFILTEGPFYCNIDSHPMIIMERGDCNLEDMLYSPEYKYVSLEDKKSIINQVLCTIQYINYNNEGVYHFDTKKENIVVINCQEPQHIRYYLKRHLDSVMNRYDVLETNSQYLATLIDFDTSISRSENIRYKMNHRYCYIENLYSAILKLYQLPSQNYKNHISSNKFDYMYFLTSCLFSQKYKTEDKPTLLYNKNRELYEYIKNIQDKLNTLTRIRVGELLENKSFLKTIIDNRYITLVNFSQPQPLEYFDVNLMYQQLAFKNDDEKIQKLTERLRECKSEYTKYPVIFNHPLVSGGENTLINVDNFDKISTFSPDTQICNIFHNTETNEYNTYNYNDGGGNNYRLKFQ